jgi:hypothetical protein
LTRQRLASIERGHIRAKVSVFVTIALFLLCVVVSTILARQKCVVHISAVYVTVMGDQLVQDRLVACVLVLVFVFINGILFRSIGVLVRSGIEGFEVIGSFLLPATRWDR